jgi:hypothetical protein
MAASALVWECYPHQSTRPALRRYIDSSLSSMHCQLCLSANARLNSVASRDIGASLYKWRINTSKTMSVNLQFSDTTRTKEDLGGIPHRLHSRKRVNCHDQDCMYVECRSDALALRRGPLHAVVG